MKNLVLFLFLFVFSISISYATNDIDNKKSRSNSSNKSVVMEDQNYIPTAGESIIYEENFNGDNTPTGLAARNWLFVNVDNGGTSTVFNGNTAVFSAFEGPPNGYAAQNFQGANVLYIDQWLISPQFTVGVGDTVSFYWRNPTPTYNDSVFLKISSGGSAIADFTQNLGRFSVPSGVWTKYSYVFTTAGLKRFAFHYYHTDGGAGTHSDYWGVDLFQVIAGTLVGPGLATNPTPANSAAGVNITSTTLTWTNPTGVTSQGIFFGTSPGSLPSVYSGTPKTSHALATLAYGTTYYWRVDETGTGGTTTGSTWSFTTIADPSDSTRFKQNFETATFPPTGWALEIGGATTQYWTRQTTASGYGVGAGAARYAFYNATTGTIQSLVTETFIPTQIGFLAFDHAYATYTGGENDKLQIETSTDNGTTWTVFKLLNGGNTGELVTAPGQSGVFVPTATQWATKRYAALPEGTNRVKFKAISAFGNNLWLDNIMVINYVPVEFTSFVANTNGNTVTLNWETATETNNKGFEVQRKEGGNSYAPVGFINGKGTTTQTSSYTFVDKNIADGKYSYRLKQVDFDGTSAFSSVVETEITSPSVYSLEQNYPNPFNPSTSLTFSLAADSKVSLKVFNILGQEIAVLVNGTMQAGRHSVVFNANNLFSGVYFARLEAKGNDGSSFSSYKKMILNK